ncbi:DUF5946 family protein [Pseudonocardia sp. TRM90224]|uniref:DUF5946 family protein n=1 Tax=Pseudonocardia sp. TRM90224 TaxID=2812678 RepID=UPI001E571241|nr:DUF5946 family protein [Pseudonocardia sp. TRM90224]
MTDELFHELLALDHSRRPPWGPLHGVVVACHLLQTAPGQVRSDDPRLVLLRDFVDGGLQAVAERAAASRRGNSHRSRSAWPPEPSGPELAEPGGFAVTIADVAVEGTFPADGYEERVARWAAATLGAWTGTP